MFSAYFMQQRRLFLFIIIFVCINIVIFALVQGINPVWASDSSVDLKQEKYWKSLLSKQIKMGQAIDLNSGQQTFFAIYKKQNLLKEKGSVILLHDKAGHPDWKNVIRPLRINLTKHGWNTLSIQMPLKNKPLKKTEELQAFYQQGYSRLDSALQYLKDQKAPNIFLIAYGSNNLVVLNYYKNNPKRDINGVVLISLATENSLSLLEEINLPVLDIYGSNDFDSVTLTARQRISAAKRSGNKYYSQQQIHYADHFFSTDSDKLIKRIHSWMVSTISR
ncbi:MAG: DUF3530 family protein [Pseudomonadota bacterium]